MHYTILKYWVKFSLRFFYYRHQVVGLKNIPKKGAVIFAGNHQNAPMDAFNIICNCGREPYFATRADLFKKDWMKKILLSLKMYPVFRLSDGRKSMQQNEKAFDFFSQKLAEGKSVGIFPEGAASYKYQLLPFKKGMARLALRTLEKKPNTPLYIIPSGLQYERKHDYQGDLLLQFGKPILVNDYFELYQEKPAKAIRQLTLDTHKKLTELIIHIPDENYELKNQQRELIHHNTKGNLLTKFNASKNPTTQFINKNTKQFPFLVYCLFPPILILGAIFYFPFRTLFDIRTHKNVKDSQFFATSKFIHGLIFFLFYYLFFGFLIYIFSSIQILILLILIQWGGRWLYRLIHKIYPN